MTELACPAVIVTDRPSFRQRGCYIKTIIANVQLGGGEGFSGRDSQGAYRQDELMGGKPPVLQNSDSVNI
jgi:hypothetical protein